MTSTPDFVPRPEDIEDVETTDEIVSSEFSPIGFRELPEIPSEEILVAESLGEADNSTGYLAAGLAGAAALGVFIQFTAGGIPMLVPGLLALAGIYYGIRGIGVASRNPATSKLLPWLSIVVAIVALVSIALYYLVIANAVAAVVNSGG